MMISSIADILYAYNAGQTHTQRFLKNAGAASVDTFWNDWAFQSGQPAYNARVGTANTFTPQIAEGNDAIFFPGIASGKKRYLAGMTVRPLASNASQASIDFVLFDLIGYYPLIDGDSTDPQDMNNTAPLPRYTDGKGVGMVLVNHVAPAVQAGLVTINYTDQADAAKSITVGVPNNGINRIVSGVDSVTTAGLGAINLPLASGSSGVKRVDSLTYTTPPGGLHCLYLIKTIATATHYHDALLQADTSGVKSAFEKCMCTGNGHHLPEIPDGAHISYFYRVNGGGRSLALFGDMTFIWN
jgi:hypothetical protein